MTTSAIKPIGRREPYTTAGIKRVPCARCGKKPSRYQFDICALNHRHVPLCRDCDIALNRLVIVFLGVPDVDAMMRGYIVGEFGKGASVADIAAVEEISREEVERILRESGRHREDSISGR